MWIRFTLVMFLAGCSHTAAPGNPASTKTRVLPNVAVAPWAMDDPATAWIGEAVAGEFESRLFARADLNFCSLRQIHAAMRQARLQPADLQRAKARRSLGRHLGASHLLVGRVALEGEQLKGEAQLIAVDDGKELARIEIAGPLRDLFQQEDRLAQALTAVLGGSLPHPGPAAAQVPIEAIEQVARTRLLLRPQSLSPRAANPDLSLGIAEDTVAQATRLASAAVDQAPDWTTAHAALALAEAIGGQNDAAHQELDRAEALAPAGAPLAILAREFTFMRQGRFEDAERVLRTSLEAHPGFLHARASLAELLLHFGRLRESRAAFQAYLARVPDQPWVMAKLAYVEARRDKNAEALKLSQQALAIIPSSAYLATELASRQVDVGDLKGAEATLRKVLARAPDHIRAQVRLGYVQLLAGDDDAAIATSEKALKLSQGPRTRKDRAYAHLNLARAYGHKGDIERSLTQLEQARAEGDVGLEEFEMDPALEAVRSDPRYMDIVD